MLEQESPRVRMNGMVGDAIKGSSVLDSGILSVDVKIWLNRLSSRDDLLRLCREVKLSSKGFISGGSLDILRKMTPR